MRIVVAMSGGVDSAVAAALLKQQGHDIIGVTLRLYDETDSPDAGLRGCCGNRAIEQARRTAAQLGIRHYVWDYRPQFAEHVISEFCAEYGRGRTPNPCLRCNTIIKFGLLLQQLPALSAERLATGHYARILRLPDGRSQLLRARDLRKDQSYFLFQLTQEQLAQTLMPLGGLTKTEVRNHARRLGLANAGRPESQDICFVPRGDCSAYLRQHHPEYFRPGPVMDTAGRIIGRHQGTAGCTPGQRKGLGIATGTRMYIVRIDPLQNAVILGTMAEALQNVLEAGNLFWTLGEPPQLPIRVWAKVRSQGPGSPALVEPAGLDRVRVSFAEPQFAPAPGQAVVFWQEDLVVGGGTIEPAAAAEQQKA